MFLIISIINFLIVLLLVRLLIRPIEVNFNQIYGTIYKITDYVLKPLKTLFREDSKSVFLSVCALVILRGLFYILIYPAQLLTGIGISFLDLFRLLFQFYMVVWFIAVLTGDRSQTSVISLAQRAFLPLSRLTSRLGISRKHFSTFAFVLLLLTFSILTYLIHCAIPTGDFRYFTYHYQLFLTLPPPFTLLHGIGESLLLIINLFPGFFTLIIIVGALLSWVSPDPYNPIVQTIYGISEPLLTPFRRIIPNLGGIDITPIIAIICFQFCGVALRQLVGAIVGAILRVV